MIGDPGRYTVLNVNDNETARYVVGKMLGNAGFRVIEAGTGADAIEMCERLLPDVVVLDVKLPDIDGYAVCRRIKSTPATASIGVLHTSATFVTSDRKVHGLEAGADGYLTQPFEPAELVAVVKSLLRIKQQEQELRARNELLAEADRRKDEFLAMLAHELRNPLAAMTMTMPMLERLESRTPSEQRARDVIRRQTGHLSRLVDDLLDVSRVTRGRIGIELREVELLPLIEHAFASARDRWSEARDQVFRISTPPGRIVVRADPTRLEQVLVNLLDNASKYTDPGGEIGLEVTPEGTDLVRIRVRDTGIGLAPEMLPVVFDLFSQAAGLPLARSRGGLGIGLTLVKRLVELHGGTVEAQSDGLGHGSSFVVRLPVLESLRSIEPAVANDRPEARGGKVLVVEDNPDIRESLVDLCDLWGHRVLQAADGHEGVRLAQAELPDAMVVDIGLPGIDGFEVARRIREDQRTCGIRMIALTGYGSPGHKERAIAAGFDRHMVKPVDTNTLEEALATALGSGAANDSERSA